MGVNIDTFTGTKVIEFGTGDIIVDTMENVDTGLVDTVGLHLTEEALEVGEQVDASRDGYPQVFLKFDNVASVDVVIKALNQVRKNLVVKQIRDLTEEIHRTARDLTEELKRTA
ncbi:hypothetical protein [Bacillus thuringiensis]|uniref:hypothetical protein n=1 Tax=Bacillus thuringiensis TaxID=1428 RepID=UPI0026E345E5|nr:hypothetical protein [Bacillus thuringiensis]MDO6628735.1 hypothetical protein [Bacillus thuringiensis]MDO6659343.1 hypothetical protein [Bacillus thuringiensis]MDO6698926.1 hypothetical protein [Bacillus thuringiensis]